MQYIIYNNQSGAIAKVVTCPPDQIEKQLTEPNLSYIEGYASNEMQYISNEQILDRPNNPSIVDKTTVIANGVDKIILSATPIGAIVTIDSVSDTSDGTDIDLVFDITGTYTLKVELFPYLDFEETINAA